MKCVPMARLTMGRRIVGTAARSYCPQMHNAHHRFCERSSQPMNHPDDRRFRRFFCAALINRSSLVPARTVVESEERVPSEGLMPAHSLGVTAQPHGRFVDLCVCRTEIDAQMASRALAKSVSG